MCLVYITLIIRRCLVWFPRGIALGSVVLILGCPAPQHGQDASVFDAGTDAGFEIVDAGPPPPATLEPTVIAAQKDGGAGPITANAQIEEATALTISLPTRLKDFRLRLMDWNDKIVVSDDELLADGKTYVLTPTEPLKSGRSYTLKLDAELGPIITDEIGGTWNDWELPFHLAGDVVPEPATRKPAKKKSK